MTELHETSRQPVSPGTPDYTRITSEQTARVAWQQQVEQEAAQRRPDSTYDPRLYQWREPPQPQPVVTQRPERGRRFNPRWVAWVAVGFALMWTLGVAIDAVSGTADPADPAKYAVGAAVVAVIAFLIPRQRDHGT